MMEQKRRWTVIIAGLILNMLGVIILGFQKYDTIVGGGNVPNKQWLYNLGWVIMFIGFALMLAAEIIKKNS
jgi:uncharacterized membrane protein